MLGHITATCRKRICNCLRLSFRARGCRRILRHPPKIMRPNRRSFSGCGHATMMLANDQYKKQRQIPLRSLFCGTIRWRTVGTFEGARARSSWSCRESTFWCGRVRCNLTVNEAAQFDGMHLNHDHTRQRVRSALQAQCGMHSTAALRWLGPAGPLVKSLHWHVSTVCNS